MVRRRIPHTGGGVKLPPCGKYTAATYSDSDHGRGVDGSEKDLSGWKAYLTSGRLESAEGYSSSRKSNGTGVGAEGSGCGLYMVGAAARQDVAQGGEKAGHCLLGGQ